VVTETLPGLIDNMSRQAFWDDPETQEKLLTGLPNYRLSKFQPALPDQFAAEMVGRYLLDVDGVVGFLG
jgi:ATP-dependent Lhr-like helicase